MLRNNSLLVNICVVIFVTFFVSWCKACACQPGNHCCLNRTDSTQTLCKVDSLRCLDSSFPDQRCERPKSWLQPICPNDNCAKSDYWCEERGDCINKNQECDCGPEKAYCLRNKNTQYSCVNRAEVGNSPAGLNWCPDGSCADDCVGNYSTVECPKGEIQCGPDCKNKTEIVNFRPCGNKCIQAKEYCYFPTSPEPEPVPTSPEPEPVPMSPEPVPGPPVDAIIEVSSIPSPGMVLAVVACCVGLFFCLLKNGNSMLYGAVQDSNEKRVRQLLAIGRVNPNTAGPDGSYPLHLAAKHGNSSITSLLLLHGAKVDQHNNLKNTPLSIAAQWGRLDVARQLLEEGANVNHQMDTGWTPLHAAVTQNHKDMVVLLCEKNADLTLPATSERVDPSGGMMNPLELARKKVFKGSAAQRTNSEIIGILQEKMNETRFSSIKIVQ